MFELFVVVSATWFSRLAALFLLFSALQRKLYGVTPSDVFPGHG